MPRKKKMEPYHGHPVTGTTKMAKRNPKPIEDPAPLPRIKQEAKNWAAAGANLEGKNTSGMVMREMPARAISNQSGTRYYTEKEPMMFESRATPNRGKTKGMVKRQHGDKMTKRTPPPPSQGGLSTVGAAPPGWFGPGGQGTMPRPKPTKPTPTRRPDTIMPVPNLKPPVRATKMAKGQGAFINGKPASADLTKAMRPRKKG